MAQASLSKPAELNPPAAKQEDFAKKFGITWKDALANGQVFNAVDGCKRLGIDGESMDKTWVRPSHQALCILPVLHACTALCANSTIGIPPRLIVSAEPGLVHRPLLRRRAIC